MATGYDKYFGFDTTQRKTLEKMTDGTEEALKSFAAAITSLQLSVSNLNAWATALATKLNADAGVTDTDYDTDPQA